MDRQTNNKCLERIKNWRNDFLQATTDVSNPKQSLWIYICMLQRAAWFTLVGTLGLTFLDKLMIPATNSSVTESHSVLRCWNDPLANMLGWLFACMLQQATVRMGSTLHIPHQSIVQYWSSLALRPTGNAVGAGCTGPYRQIRGPCAKQWTGP